MATALKPGARYKSAVCDTQVMVVKAPAGEHDLRCGGAEMIAPTATGSGEPDAALAGGTLIGKRYVNEDESLELLCTKGGKGSLSLGAAALEVKQAKQLPSSD
ncbi:hypothetical protein [Solimonas terrae]|uniref:Uncharacterized protein n=1 Tax=Solimonas terrae TaxID=1396819 RepID=A0A6M2BRE5_9GAMM|nr:hypothetical protein [Solimonas terrae]NGY04900.1 hypothetical protein [Solimonas terrae]